MIATKQIRTITLDLDDTLWDIASVIQQAEKHIYQEICHRFPRAAERYGPHGVPEIRQKVISMHPEIAHDLTTVRLLTFRSLLAEFDYDVQEAEVLLSEFLEERHKVKFFPDAISALIKLSGRYPLVAITNGNANIEKLGIAKFFVGQMSARKAGVLKPDPKIFDLACEIAGEVPSNLLHVGDHPVDDVLGAIDAGYQAVWLNRRMDRWQHEVVPHAEVSDLIELVDLLGL
ncbi:MAG: HAD family hydrolase [Acidiferrobacteraceae bacterium]|nr:HAD family hydrolase [Acidiferrobacteraceae bacterium]|tara:strand:- start:637 stop:1329 length:693 start_codon:yes stop_codon:yes gene_type:complete